MSEQDAAYWKQQFEIANTENHEAIAADRAVERALGAIEALTVTQAMVDRFLSWPLPETVCSDPCATVPGYKHRIGTNLLTAVEARAMLEHVLGGAYDPR